jgi:VWFA-related protein
MSSIRLRRIGLPVGLLIVLLSMQTPAAQRVSATQPAERAADLLSVTFAAVDAQGTAVPDLRAEDVSIRIDGRQRTLRSLQLISFGAPAARSAAPVLPAPFGTNIVGTAGRTVVLALDEDSFQPGREQALRDAVDRFVGGLGPRDLVSLVTMPYGGVKVPMTTDHVRLKTALATIVGRASGGAQSGSDFACRTRTTLEALTRSLQGLGVRETPSVVLFITGGLAPPRRDSPMSMAPGMCELSLDSFREVGAAAGAARAHFYVIPPDNIMGTGTLQRENIAGVGSTGSDNPIGGIEQLLGVTGGKLFNIGAAGDTGLDHVLRENAAYYLATLDVQRGDRGGRPHQLEVRVSRRAVDVRSSRAIAFAESDAAGSRPTAPSPRDMLSTTRVFHDLPLRAAAYSSVEESGSAIRVVVLAEPVEPGVKLASVMAGLFDRDGKGIASWVAQPADLERAPIVGAVTAPPGAYRLRVAAIDAMGRSGTADYDADIELARTGPLKISSILLGLSRGGSFVPKLQFESEPVAIAYVEMMGAAAGARVTATLELAETANGPALVSVPLTIESGGADRYIARGPVAIGAVPPGDYAIRAMVGLEGHPMTRVVRTLRKVVAAR